MMQIMAGQKVRNDSKPRPIGIGIRIGPQPKCCRNNNEQQGASTDDEQTETDLDEAGLKVSVHAGSSMGVNAA